MTIWHQIWSLAFAVGVVGNLTASAVLGVPALLHLHRKLDRHHREHMELLNASNRIRDTNTVSDSPNASPDSDNWPANSDRGKMD